MTTKRKNHQKGQNESDRARRRLRKPTALALAAASLLALVAGAALWWPDGGSPAEVTAPPSVPEPVVSNDRETPASSEDFVILHASWGAVDDDVTAPEAAPLRLELSDRARKRQAFEERAGERWKGTEIFVRR